MHNRKTLLFLALLLGVSMACAPLSNLGTSSTSTPASVQRPEMTSTGSSTNVTEQPPAGSDEYPLTLDELVTGTASLTSAKYHLTTSRANGQLIQLDAEIDEIGSKHVVKMYPDPQADLLRKGGQIPPSKTEFYVVNGTVYSPDENGTLQVSDANGMNTFLQTALLSSDGPAFWLKVLPAGSLTEAGDEQYNEFQARKYAIQGTVEGLTITGTLWIEPSVPALLGANLAIPAKLAGPETDGSLQIDFQMEKTEVALIQPDLSQPTTTPIPSASIPGGLSIYSDARNIVSQPGMFMYDTDADVATITQFYLDQFKAGGWQINGQALEAEGTYIANWTKGSVSINVTITSNSPSGSLIMISCDACN